MTYRQRIFIYFFSVFTLFTIVISAFQVNREKTYRHSRIDSRLDQVVSVVHRYLEHRNSDIPGNFAIPDSILSILAGPDMRVTIISSNGNVLFDSYVGDRFEDLTNHLDRQEVKKALHKGSGSAIRHSETTGQDFYYFARDFGDFFIRTAMVYDPGLKSFLQSEKLFLVVVALLFVLMWLMLHLVTRKLSVFVLKLRDFAIRAGRNEEINSDIDFGDSEFGDIRRQIVSIYNKLKRAKDDLGAEKERLYSHLYALKEGIAFFSSSKEKILANSHFIHYINLISEKSSISAEVFFNIPEFRPLIEKIDRYLDPDVVINPRKLPQVQATVSRQELYFRVQGIIFIDKSFEVLIEDITKPEKRRLLKQQLTSNITHELKTPLASITGYLETILNNDSLTPDKQRHFVERAFAQAGRLNELLNDMSLLNNIEDAGVLFDFRQVKLLPLIQDVAGSFETRLAAKNISVAIEVSDKTFVCGNDSLLASVFRNFMENSVNYAGDGVEIRICQYLEDKKFCYFSYSDSGRGIPEKHHARIFERFYRVDEGRTRSQGGTGLGLAIVRNAIMLHKGEISVRNRTGGGVEFLFSLAK